MDNTFLVILALFGGVACGGGIVGAMVWWKLRRNNHGPTSTEFPPVPEADTFLDRPNGIDDAVQSPSPISPPPPPSDQYSTLANMPRPSGVYPWLEGIGGMVAGQHIQIRQEETVIGRSRVCDIQFQDPKVSRQHAMLRLYKGRYFLQDMQSSRGTLVNSQRVQTHLLQDGDHIRMGDTILIYHAPRH